MSSKSLVTFLILSALSFSQSSEARILWSERHGRAVFLHPRRFGQQNPAVINKLAAACPGQVCGTLSGQAITPLLANAGECTQQDMADLIINASRQFDASTQANMIAIAQEYRQAEKNTPPDFSANPPINRNSVFCQAGPKNVELAGLVQAQDPANDPNVFFDPASEKSVQKGTQANTFPFNGSFGSATPSFSSSFGRVSPSSTSVALPVSSSSAILGNFGSCSIPQVQFGVGFDNRKETSFQPANKTSFNHGSAQNIDIITRFICDTLTNSCKADQTAKNTCASAITAADARTQGTGAQADAFNGVFGIQTNFAAIASVDDHGNICSSSSGNSSVAFGPSAGLSCTSSATNPTSSGSASAGGIGNFGSCSVPQIEFGVGFDGRKETSYQPVNKTSFSHGSAQNIDIITQFICDTLTNSCAADQTAKNTCANAKIAADVPTKGKGAQADAFNNVFGITTNFAAVPSVDNQGHIVAGTGTVSNSSSSAHSSTQVASSFTSVSNPAASSISPASNNLQIFTGSIGGITAAPVTFLGNGQFQVAGNSVFNNLYSALVRSCNVQHNQCSNAANSSGNKVPLTVGTCGNQQAACVGVARSASS